MWMCAKRGMRGLVVLAMNPMSHRQFAGPGMCPKPHALSRCGLDILIASFVRAVFFKWNTPERYDL